MVSIGKLIFDVTMVIAMLWIVNRLLDTLYQRKAANPAYFAAWGILALYQYYAQASSNEPFLLTSLITTLSMVFIAFAGYEGVGKEIFLLIVAFMGFFMVIEMMVYYGMNLLSMAGATVESIGVVISKITIIMIIYLFSVIWKRSHNRFLPPAYFWILLFVPSGCVYIANNQFYHNPYSWETMIVLAILLLINILILEVYSKISRSFELEKENTIYSQQIEMISRNTNEQKKMMEDFHRERHDWKNKLIVLRHVMEEGNTDAALKSIDTIIQSYNHQDILLNTGNAVIDAIINYKYILAREEGIQFNLKVTIPEELPIEQCDLGVVLGNALDNAIEATKVCKTTEKRIDIKMDVKKGALIIRIINPYEHILQMDKSGTPRTTKQDAGRHGYGIASITKIAERYFGEAIIETKNNLFQLTVLMNFV